MDHQPADILEVWADAMTFETTEELQDWVLVNRDRIPKPELYPKVRRWYARDRGVSTLCEIATLAGLAAAAEGCS